ncbi:hypothetical protein P7L75_07040 [Tistrella mobilis]|uniref:hypothetical protein n=1 Tax=Tistrella mobilis TaxID=171437 RepID=UPI003556C71C
MNRRTFLSLSAGCVTAATGSAALALPAAPQTAESLARLGRRAIADLPAADVTALRAEGQRLPQRDISALRSMKREIAEDFRQSRTVQIGGISFSRTETSIFILAADSAGK